MLGGKGLLVQNCDLEPAGKLLLPVQMKKNVWYMVLAMFLNEQTVLMIQEAKGAQGIVVPPGRENGARTKHGGGDAVGGGVLASGLLTCEFQAEKSSVSESKTDGILRVHLHTHTHKSTDCVGFSYINMLIHTKCFSLYT